MHIQTNTLEYSLNTALVKTVCVQKWAMPHYSTCCCSRMMTIYLGFSKKLTAKVIISNIEPRLKNYMYHYDFIGIEYNENAIYAN